MHSTVTEIYLFVHFFYWKFKCKYVLLLQVEEVAKGVVCMDC